MSDENERRPRRKNQGRRKTFGGVTPSVPDPESFDFEAWRDQVAGVVLDLAATLDEFDSFDVRDRCTVLGIEEPPHPNHWGTVYSTLHKGGYIVPVAWSAGRRARLRGGGVRVWTATRRGGAL